MRLNQASQSAPTSAPYTSHNARLLIVAPENNHKQRQNRCDRNRHEHRSRWKKKSSSPSSESKLPHRKNEWMNEWMSAVVVAIPGENCGHSGIKAFGGCTRNVRHVRNNNKVSQVCGIGRWVLDGFFEGYLEGIRGMYPTLGEPPRLWMIFLQWHAAESSKLQGLCW